MHHNSLEHIAFILDGNKRWAKKNNINLKNAYKTGLENISDLIEDCLKIKLKYLTLFTLSSENIKRQSVNNIFQVIYDDFSSFSSSYALITNPCNSATAVYLGLFSKPELNRSNLFFTKILLTWSIVVFGVILYF